MSSSSLRVPPGDRVTLETRRALLGGGISRHGISEEGAGDGTNPNWAKVARFALEKASDLGFIRAGVASLEPFDDPVRRLEAFIAKGRHGTMEYLSHRQPDGSLTRADPCHLMPGALSAVVAALPYPAPHREREAAGKSSGVARYARGADYHHVLKEKLLRLADEIASFLNRPITVRACVDSAPLLERDLAIRAGFAFLGKNTLAIAPGAGSHFLLGELLLDIPLPPSQHIQPQGCGSCRACLDACPTDAFIGPFELDAKRCISYLTIESQADVPRSLREPVGLHLFGCDVCQSVCPFNAAGAQRPSAPELTAHPMIDELTPEMVLTLGSSAHKRLVRDSALRRASRNQLARNAAVVLGNRGRLEDVPLLAKQAAAHASEQVRLHCVWALGSLLHRHGVSEAQMALQSLAACGRASVAAEALRTLDSEAFEQAGRTHAAADTHGNEGITPLDPV